ncbi:hypothetical protein ABZ281_48535 [Streptomyces sp. NPDC006265]
MFAAFVYLLFALGGSAP